MQVRESVDSVEGGVGARLAPLEDPDDGEIQFGRLKPDRADTAGSDADTDTMTEPSTSPSKALVINIADQAKWALLYSAALPA